MKENKYCVKYKNMYLKNLYLDNESVKNQFISGIEFVCRKTYLEVFNQSDLNFVKEKLVLIGFNENLIDFEIITEEE